MVEQVNLEVTDRISKKYKIPLTIQNLQTKTSYQSKYKIEKKLIKTILVSILMMIL